MTTGLVAVRRNLTPGAVFFRQSGNVVEYSLDGVSWRIAFTLPSSRAISQTALEYYIDKSIDQYITDITNTFEINSIGPNIEGAITINNLTEIAGKGTSRMQKNLCAASKALAATFAAMVNVHLEDEADLQLNWTSALLLVGQAAFNIAVKVFGKGIGEIALRYINVGFASSAAGTAWWASLDNAQDLTDCDVEQIACAIYRRVTAQGADRDALAGALIWEFDFGQCTGGNMSTALAEWFSEWIYTWPELWTAFLAGLTDEEVLSCNECGGCEDVDLRRDDITTNGIWIWNTGWRSPRIRTAAVNYKELSLTIPVENDAQQTQVDTVEFDYIFNRYNYTTSFPVSPLVLTITGPFSQSADRGSATFLTQNAATYTGNFTNVTLAYGVSAVNIGFRLTYGAISGQATQDPTADVIITRVKICYRS